MNAQVHNIRSSRRMLVAAAAVATLLAAAMQSGPVPAAVPAAPAATSH